MVGRSSSDRWLRLRPRALSIREYNSEGHSLGLTWCASHFGWGGYFYFTGGHAPVRTSDPDMPLERDALPQAWMRIEEMPSRFRFKPTK